MGETKDWKVLFYLNYSPELFSFLRANRSNREKKNNLFAPNCHLFLEMVPSVISKATYLFSIVLFEKGDF